MSARDATTRAALLIPVGRLVTDVAHTSRAGCLTVPGKPGRVCAGVRAGGPGPGPAVSTTVALTLLALAVVSKVACLAGSLPSGPLSFRGLTVRSRAVCCPRSSALPGSVAVMDPGPSASQEEFSPLAAGRLESGTLAQRLEQATARSRAITLEIEQGQPQWQRLRDSAFARLRARLDSMPVIEQAKGVLMAQNRCGPDEAFDLLRRASQRANVKVSVLAAQIVEQVASPGAAADRPRP